MLRKEKLNVEKEFSSTNFSLKIKNFNLPRMSKKIFLLRLCFSFISFDRKEKKNQNLMCGKVKLRGVEVERRHELHARVRQIAGVDNVQQYLEVLDRFNVVGRAD